MYSLSKTTTHTFNNDLYNAETKRKEKPTTTTNTNTSTNTNTTTTTTTTTTSTTTTTANTIAKSYDKANNINNVNVKAISKEQPYC